MASRPVIAICGTTGVGKSKLAIELALKLSETFDHHGWKGGVVINADAMQAYKGFNTITNKIPLGERAGVDHVLMDFKDPTEQYVVGQWINDATQAVSISHGLARRLSGLTICALDRRCTWLAESPNSCRWDRVLDPASHLSRSACR
jgi:tRNA A37 N6-isopentenylltransferase MiaA